MATVRPRPLSPHMTIWRWRVHMVVSILHRVTGNAMAFGAVLLFLWWLLAAASGPEAYRTFYGLASSWFGLVVGIVFTLIFFQHMMSGIRHLVMDTGSAYEIRTSRRFATSTFAVSIPLTILFWLAVLL